MEILAVGVATLDIVNRVERYPDEDTEIRALDQRMTRGGNATNTLVVLNQLGHRTSWAGTLAGDAGGDLIQADLQRRGVDLRYVRRYRDGCTPTSCVISSRHSGSRTIVHYRRLPEYSAEDFAAIPVRAFDWIHFEGRHVAALERMFDGLAPDHPCSLEVEKPRPGIERLFSRPGLLLFSSHYARARGWDDGAGLLRSLGPRLRPGAVALCAWGERGAWGMTAGGGILHAPAFPPPRLVDTLGAGDVFNAAAIDQRLRGADLPRILEAACRLAGRKCGQPGFDGIQSGEDA